MTLYIRRFGGSTPSGPEPGSITFTGLPQNVEVQESGSAVFSWAATASSGTPILYTIETEDVPGGGDGGTGWWFFSTQSSSTYTFYGLQLSDNNTNVRITASNGVDTNAVAYAMITVSGTPPPPPGGGLTIDQIYFMGHSLMNEGLGSEFSIDNNPVPALPNVNTPSYIATVCSAAGFTANGVYAESGGNVITDALANLQASVAQWSDCDTIVLDFIINGDETPAQFMTAAQACSTYIRSQVPPSGPEFADPFTRANGTNIASGAPVAWTEKSAWDGTTITGYEISTNKLILNLDDYGIAWAGQVTDADHYSQCVINGVVSFTSIHGPIVRGDNSCTGYMALAFSDRVRLYALNAGAFVILDDTGTLTLGTGDHEIRLEAEGTGTVTLRVYVDDVLQLTKVDSTYGFSGLYVGVAGNGTAGTVDLFEASPLAGGTPPPPTMNIIWMEGHSWSGGTTGGLSYVLERWQGKNPILQTMLGAGDIDGVIPWAAYAGSHLNIYQADGVHHTDQAPYAEQIVYNLTLLAEGGTPPPGASASRHIGFDNYADNHFGNPLALTGPGNVPILTNQLAFPFKAVSTSSITHLSFNLKYDMVRTGYHAGDGGVMSAYIYAALSTGAPTGSALGTLSLDPVTIPSNNQGNLGKWAFNSPIAVTAGNNYAVVIANTDASPTVNWFSVNLMVEFPTDVNTNLPGPDMYFKNIASGDGFFNPWMKGSSAFNPDGGTGWNNYYGRTDDYGLSWHNSCFELYYTNGVRQGQAYPAADYGGQTEIAMSASNQFRQYMLSKRGGRTATHLCFRSGYHGLQWPTGTVVGAIVRDSALNQLAICNIVKDGSYWGRGTLSTPVTIANNTEYVVDLRVISGPVFTQRMMYTSQNQSGWECDHPGASNPYTSYLPGQGLKISTNGGSSWTTPSAGFAGSLSVFFETTV